MINRIGYFIGAVAATMVGWVIVQKVERLTLLEREAWAQRLHEQLEAVPTFVPPAAEECCGECQKGCWNG